MAASRTQTVVAWFVASRLIIVVLGIVGVSNFPDLKACADLKTCAVVDNTTALNPEVVWNKWDSLHYQQIAEHGYGYELETKTALQGAAAYFPLYPLTIRLILLAVPSLSFFWVGSILSNLFTLAALLWLTRSLVTDLDSSGRVMAVFMMSAGSFYLSIPYTEGLFLLLVVATVVMTRRKQFVIAGLCAGLAATTRVHGLALIAVPAIASLMDSTATPRARWTRAIVAVAVFAAAFSVYLMYLSRAYGSWDAFMTSQAGWDNASPYPFRSIVGLFEFPRRIAWWLHGGFWALYVGLLIRYWRRLPLGEVLFCAGVLVISTQQAGFQGIYRYMTPLVPLSLAIADDRASARHAILVINLIFGVLMLLSFVTTNRLTV
jgi:Gpi18-like mannosyltransferase